jgi:hypothetical protein
MKTLCNLSLSALLLASLSFAQTATTQTTLAQAVSRGDKTITLTACSTVQAAGLAPVTGLYMDREYMTAISNVSPTNTGCTFNVQRMNGALPGINSLHASGTVVWIGSVGGNDPFDQGPNDRVGACTAANITYSPIVEVRTGNLTVCGSDGVFHKFGSFNEHSLGLTIASATTIVVTNSVVPVSGTTAIATITATGTAAGQTVTLIPTGIFTTTTAGNIGLASTAVVGKALILTWDGTKFWPSY